MERKTLNLVYHTEYSALNLSSKSHIVSFYALFLHFFFWLSAPLLCLALMGGAIGGALEAVIGSVNPIVLILCYWAPLVLVLPVAFWKPVRNVLRTYDLAFEQLLAIFGNKTPKTETRLIELRTIFDEQKVTRSQ